MHKLDIAADGPSPLGSYTAGSPRAARLCSAVELWDSAAELVRRIEDWRLKEDACWSRGRGLLDMPCRHKYNMRKEYKVETGLHFIASGPSGTGLGGRQCGQLPHICQAQAVRRQNQLVHANALPLGVGLRALCWSVPATAAAMRGRHPSTQSSAAVAAPAGHTALVVAASSSLLEACHWCGNCPSYKHAWRVAGAAWVRAAGGRVQQEHHMYCCLGAIAWTPIICCKPGCGGSCACHGSCVSHHHAGALWVPQVPCKQPMSASPEAHSWR